jgi:hypothetical protein
LICIACSSFAIDYLTQVARAPLKGEPEGVLAPQRNSPNRTTVDRAGAVGRPALLSTAACC